MKIHVGRRLFLAAAVLGAVAVFAMAFLVAPGLRSVVAGPDAGPAASAPNPGHSWSEIGDLPGTMWHSNNDGPGSGLDADMVDGLQSNQIQDADDYVSNAGYCAAAGNADTLDGQHATAFAGASHSHSAGDINAGTLGTDRYSAYSDLGAEGYLGNAAGDLAQNNGTLQATLNADLLDGLDSTAFSSPPWSAITGKPAGFADDIDNDILGGLSCASGEIAKWNGSAWQCATDDTGTGSFWSLTGNAGTTPAWNFLGTSDNQALELRVNGSRALRLEPNATSPNVIGGSSANDAIQGVAGAAICGGGAQGQWNLVTDDYGVVDGGSYNQAGDFAGTTADRPYASVGGGFSNIASGKYGTVGGGTANTAGGLAATVSGGDTSTASGEHATVSGGGYHVASGNFAAVGGGFSARATGNVATVGGGMTNTASGQGATVGGGAHNTASGSYATVPGGYSNDATDNYSTVAGGQDNQAGNANADPDDAHFATVGGGIGNTATAGVATVGGGQGNTASGGWSTVGGGESNAASAWHATVGGGEGNAASGWDATVGGGAGNTASGYVATVGGGWANVASGERATVGGGYSNEASGTSATVPGGRDNTAQGYYSFAAGRRAKANNQGCFVWGDSTDADVACNSDNGFVVRASGNIWFGTTSSPDLTTGFINTSTGAYLSTGGTWTNASDRDAKENFTPVDGQEVLARLADVPIATWNYKAEDASVPHMGPVGQDFYAAFGLGDSDTAISTVDADGVALAAIQGLYQLSQEQDARIQALEARVSALEGGAGANSSSTSALSSAMPAGWLLLGGLVVGGLVVVQRRRAGGRR
jgi:trimeric autotransporter adhesin